MRIILKENVDKLGKKGDIVDVARGFGRNYLIPKKLALEVTPSNMKMIELEQQFLKKKLEKEELTYQELIQKLNQTTLSFTRKAGEKDVIFGSVSSSDIKEALDALGFEIEKKKISLDEPIKRLGNYTVPIRAFHEEQAEIKVNVISEEKAEKEGIKNKKELTAEEKIEASPAEEKKSAPKDKRKAFAGKEQPKLEETKEETDKSAESEVKAKE